MATQSASRRRAAMELEPDNDETDAAEAEADMEAWDRRYEDERSWEMLEEDVEGRLKMDPSRDYRERSRKLWTMQGTAARVHRGMIRFLYLVVDLSRSVTETDMRPSRLVVMTRSVEAFIHEFFSQNPLSQLGVIVTRNGGAERVTSLGGSPEAHIAALRRNMDTGGDASLQNCLDMALASLADIPSYGFREVVMLVSALNTCDPGDIRKTIDACKDSSCRCSVVGTSAEVYVCKLLAEVTNGTYRVALNEEHLKELLLLHSPPPPALAGSVKASLVRMGFPQRQAEKGLSISDANRRLQVGGGYTCPRCKSRAAELPSECRACGLTLVSSPHLARSYHHLFPVAPFIEVPAQELSGQPPIDTRAAGGGTAGVPPEELARLRARMGLARQCFACFLPFTAGGGISAIVRTICRRCHRVFCFDCDAYIHTSLHNCPGCECLGRAAMVAGADRDGVMDAANVDSTHRLIGQSEDLASLAKPQKKRPKS
eukprot:jgi/Mesvir1/12286/Mv00492-RA.1